MKLNVDGAIFPKQYRARVGCVLRDDQGPVTMVATKLEMNISNPFKVELLALFCGLQLCVLLGIPNIMMESDSLSAIQAIQKKRQILMHEVT